MSTVEIKVIDAGTRRPVPAAQVGALLHRGPEGDAERIRLFFTGWTSREGVWSFQPPLAGEEPAEVLVVVRARGRKEWRSPALARTHGIPLPPYEPILTTATSPLSIEVELERGITLAGVVRDEAGSPIPDAHIGLVLSGPCSCSWPYAFHFTDKASWPPPLRTDASGRFEWLSFPRELAGGNGTRWVLTAEHRDFLPGLAHNVESLVADPDGVASVDFVLGKGASLQGAVLGPSGNPLAGAKVTVRAEPTSDQPVCISFAKEGVTSETGTFSFKGLQALPHELHVEAPGCAPHREGVDVSRPPSGLLVRIASGADLEGAVLDDAGRPVADLVVFASVPESRAFRRTTTDRSGRFRIEGLPARGDVVLKASRAFELTVTLPCAPLAIRLPRKVSLEMRLVAAEDAKPLEPPGHVILFGPGFSKLAEIEPAGRVHFADLPPGKHRVTPHIPGRSSKSIEIDVPEGGLAGSLTLRVPPGAKVKGRVTDLAGAPLAGVQVSFYGPHGWPEQTVETDAAGEYDLGVSNDRAYVVFSAPDLALRGVRLERAGVAEAPALGDVVMGPGATLRGTVKSPDGTPRASAFVKVLPEGIDRSPLPLPTALTDGSGCFVLLHVPQGKMVVSAGITKQRIGVRHGDAVEVDLAE